MYTCARGETFGTFVTPSQFAFLSIRRAIRGDLICDKSMPPVDGNSKFYNIYENG